MKQCSGSTTFPVLKMPSDRKTDLNYMPFNIMTTDKPL